MKNLYFDAFTSISYPVLIIDSNYRIKVANFAAGEQFGVPSDDLVGMLCYEATHDRDTPCWNEKNTQCPVQQVIQCKQRVKVIHKHIYKDKAVLEEIIATPLVDKANGELLIMEEFRDITELLGLDSSVLPVCSVCRKIRDINGEWLSIEEHIYKRTGADFSHSFCPDCYKDYCPKSNLT